MMQTLFDVASDLNVEVELVPLRGRDGEYRQDLQRIRLRENMTARLARFVFAHEIAHAIFGDIPQESEYMSAKQERRADEWAAQRLISLDRYREVEYLRDGHVPSMAHDLGVVSRAVIAFQRILAQELLATK